MSQQRPSPLSSAGHAGSDGLPHASARVPWAARVSAVGVWGAVGLFGVYGALHWTGTRASAPVPVQPWAMPDVDVQGVARALGVTAPVASTSAPPPMEVAGRYTLVGVVTQDGANRPGSGVALIAIDGQRALPYPVGSRMDARWRVQQVTRQTVLLRPDDGRDGPVGGDVAGGLTLKLAKP